MPLGRQSIQPAKSNGRELPARLQERLHASTVGSRAVHMRGGKAAVGPNASATPLPPPGAPAHLDPQSEETNEKSE